MLLALYGLERSQGACWGRMVLGVAGHGDLAPLCPALLLATRQLPLRQFSLLLTGVGWQEQGGLKCCECSAEFSFYLLG